MQLLLLVATLWLGSDHRAHEWLHPGADKADHECAVSLFTHGQLDAVTAAPVVIVSPQLFSFLPAPRPVTVEVSPAHLLPFSCGPPCA